MQIYETILDTLGNTPLVRLGRFCPGDAIVAAKIESFNPGSSVKDRIGPALVEAGERSGKLRPGGTIVEPTSGNTGVGLAMVAALKGYKLVCTAADKIPAEKVTLLEAFGAEVITCPTEVPADDPRSYYKVAERIRDERGAYLPYQYYNQANPEAHYRSTGPEIWRQTDGRITHWVAGIGTGGTISGVAKYLKEQSPDVRVIGVDTVGSVYAYYHEHRRMPPADRIHQYLIDGIGEDFMPETVWWDQIDEVVTVDDRAAYDATLQLARREGILCGSSGGAAAEGARRVAAGVGRDAVVVTLFPDSGERYLSKLNQKWLREKGLIDDGGER
ncbi:MAG TPA: cysteine synthase family protein [Candidatus Polarisedimenticolaceae bacterium]|nr:cysteine synthase family protein [Candidatus Polarisedimenticolaceae bacterium]